MQNKICAGYLVKGRLERLHERGGKLLDKADGIGEGYLPTFGKLELARSGVKRCEQFVVGKDIGLRELVQKARLSRVGVSRERYLEHAAFIAAFALKLAYFGKACKLALYGGDAIAHHASVDFKLAFPFTETRADASAHAIGSKVRPHPLQAGQQILVLRQTNLKSSLLACGMESEYVQYKSRSVYDLHLASHNLFQVRLLGRRQLVIEDDEVGGVCARQFGNLFGFSRAYERSRVRSLEPLGGRCHDVGAGGIDQTGKLRQRRGNRPRGTRSVDPDEHRALPLFFVKGACPFHDKRFEFRHTRNQPLSLRIR